MEKEFVPYEESLEVKQLGFDEPCYAYRDGTGHLMIKPMPHCAISAPTFSQAFRWFREKYELNHEIPYAGRKGEYHAFVNDYIYGNNGNSPSVFSYEEAELACLRKLIEIVKQKV